MITKRSAPRLVEIPAIITYILNSKREYSAEATGIKIWLFWRTRELMSNTLLKQPEAFRATLEGGEAPPSRCNMQVSNTNAANLEETPND